MTGRQSIRAARWFSWCLLSLAACWTSTAVAQPGGFQDLVGLKGPSATPKPQFTTSLTSSGSNPGDVATLTIDVKLPEGYYIYSTTGEFEGRTRIETKATGLEPLDAEFIPDRAPKTVFEPLLQSEISKFHDHVTWKKRYKISSDANLATIALTGELSGQYCTEGTDQIPGNCIPIIPSYEFQVSLREAKNAPAVRYEYEERPKKGKTNPGLLKFKLFPQDAAPGEKVMLSITMELDQGWHTFSLTQKGEGGSPTEIDVAALHGLQPVSEGFQPDRAPEVEQPLPDIKLEVHNERVTWSREFEVLRNTKPGEYAVRGTIAYQTCKSSCLPVREVSFELGDASKLQPANVDKSTAEEIVPPPANRAEPVKPIEKTEVIKPVEARVGKKLQDQGLFGFLLTAIGFGLVSLLTPCVFPMVPITVSFFLKQSETDHHRPLAIALVFCGSIVATFTVLGIGIAAIFGAAQLTALANNPWLNIIIGAVFVAFAFNMLGMFEIRIPSELLTFTANKEQAGGYVGAVFMALTFTLTSFTCTFAFAGSLLVAAAQGQYYWPIIGMLAFGTAFASPFFFLAMVPSLLKKLPKSGGWMNAVKVVMGLVEIGAAVKFFSVADLAWNPEPVLFDFVFVMIVWLVLSLTIAFYLMGVIRLPHDVPIAGISVGRLVLVMAFLGLSCNLAVALVTHERSGGWIMGQIIAFAPPRFDSQVGAGIAGSTTDLPSPVLSHEGIWFTLDVDKGISHATKLNRPLLFDFTGVNCVNCRLMEGKMAMPQNRSRLEKLVLVQLYSDKVPTVSDPAEAKRLLKRNVALQTEWFGDVTMPSYAVVTPDGKTILSTYFGNERREGEFAAFLDAGWSKWEELQPRATSAQAEFGGPADPPKLKVEHNGISYALDIEEGTSFALKRNRPLFLAFTGVNDVVGRLMDIKLSQPQNSAHLNKFIPVQLYIDKVPNVSAQVDERLLVQNRTLQTEWFGDLTVPTYVIVTPDRKTILSTFFGQEQHDGELAAFLDEGWKKWDLLKTNACTAQVEVGVPVDTAKPCM